MRKCSILPSSSRLEACPLNKSIINLLDFVVSWFFIKLFKTNDINIAKHRQREFSFNIQSDILAIVVKDRSSISVVRRRVLQIFVKIFVHAYS